VVDLVTLGDRAGLKMEYVYVLTSLKDKVFYTGLTNDIHKRVHRHNSGLVRSTKSRRPLVLVHSEAVGSRAEAQLGKSS
jgi:predicted GIY-YIG superfamily endonuclease